MATKKKGKDDGWKGRYERYRADVEIREGENEIRMCNLQSKIQRLEETLRKLQDENQKFQHNILVKNTENKNSLDTYKIEKANNEKTIKRMEVEKKKYRVEIEKLRENHEVQKNLLKQEFEQEKMLMQQKIDRLNDKLDELNAFHQKRHQILKENRDLKLQLAKNEQYASKEIADAKAEYERKIREKKLELQEDFNQKQDELRKITDRHIGVKTMNTMKKNEQLKKELHTQQSESSKVLDTNKHLEKRNRELIQQNSLSEAENKELVKRNLQLEQQIHMLHEKIDQMETLVNSGSRNDNSNHVRELNRLIEQQEYSREQLVKEVNQLKVVVENLTSENKKYQKEIEKATGIDDEIRNFLLNTLNDIKLKLGPWKATDQSYYRNEDADNWKPGNTVPASLDKLSINEREKVIRYLLSKLHRFQKDQYKTFSQYEDRSRPTLPPIHSQHVPFQERLAKFRKAKTRGY